MTGINISSKSSSSLGKVLALEEITLKHTYPIDYRDQRLTIYEHTKKASQSKQFKSIQDQTEFWITLNLIKFKEYSKIRNAIADKGGTRWLSTCYTEGESIQRFNGKGEESLWISILIQAFKIIEDEDKKAEPLRDFIKEFNGVIVNTEGLDKDLIKEIEIQEKQLRQE